LSGLYSGRLDNAGETVTLSSPTGSIVFSFTYDDNAPWPVSADGEGHSLHRRVASGDGNQASNWVVNLPSPGRAFDTDGDGMPDGWELAHGLNPDLADALADLDGDGLTNGEEYFAGTDPQDPANSLAVTIAPETGAIRLSFFAAAGRRYAIESCEDPGAGAWEAYVTFPAAGASQMREVSVPMNARQRFYRVVLLRSSEPSQNNVNAVLAQRERIGQPMIPHINHPNFGWALTAEDMMVVRGERFFEVYNGHPGVRNAGDSQRASTERIWDIILTRRLTELGLEPM
jgi:hypothetical protein